ncbi:serine hydrolase domain-containing protein [Gilvibacter sp.]|uniref:serine hydrolase domain-containing protein n=1 Tax=Gilvibacter sp. TaxID=2729997 RepID=UPI003F49E390
MRHHYLGLSLLLFLTNISYAQQYSEQLESAVNKQTRSLLKDKEIKAVSVGIYYKGETYRYYFGQLRDNNPAMLNDSSVYEIASVSKTMLGFVAAKAVLEGKINLEDEVQKYLDKPYPNLSFDGEPIRIKHLLANTSGLPHFMPESIDGIFERLSPEVPTDFYKAEAAVTKDDFWQALEAFEMTQKPGTQFYYSNAGAELMSYILENVYGKSLDELLQEELFQKCDMGLSGIEMTAAMEANAVLGYWMGNSESSPYFANTLWAGGAGVKSNLLAMTNYLEFLMETDDAVVAESRKELFHDGRTTRLGYFWRIWKDKYGTSYNHHGGSPGMQNWVYLYPDQDFAITIFTNHSGPKTPGKLKRVVDKILKELSR